MKLIEEVISFGKSGSRKAQVWMLGSVALLAGPAMGLTANQTYGFAALSGVYVLGRAMHDYGLARAETK